MPKGASAKTAQLLFSAEKALDKVKTYTAVETGIYGGKPIHLVATVSIPGRVRVSTTIGSERFQEILLDGSAYLDANAAFFAAGQVPEAEIAELANRWLKVPTAEAPDASGSLALASPRTAGLCAVGANLGSFKVAGRGKVSGRPVITVSLGDNVPGAEPGSVSIATTGPPLVLRVVQTGPTRSGGSTACGGSGTGDPADTHDVVTLSDFNAREVITAPPHAVDIGGSASTGATVTTETESTPDGTITVVQETSTTS